MQYIRDVFKIIYLLCDDSIDQNNPNYGFAINKKRFLPDQITV